MFKIIRFKATDLILLMSSIILLFIFYLYLSIDDKTIVIFSSKALTGKIVYGIKVLLKASTAVTIIVLISSVFRSKTVSNCLFVLVAFLSSFVLYMKINFGSVSVGSFASIVESNLDELYEMITSSAIPIPVFLSLLLFPLVMIFLRMKLSNTKACFFVCALLILQCLVFSLKAISNGSTTAITDSGQEYNKSSSVIDYLFKTIPSLNVFYVANDYLKLKKIEGQPISPNWHNVTSAKNKIYIVVIGESAQRSAFSSYGYSRRTSESIDNIGAVTFVSDGVSPAAQTRNSISRILAVNDGIAVDNNLNIIDLAKSAGLNTRWYSNQGSIGVHDTPVTRIAKRADKIVFHNKDYTLAQSDRVLLDDLKKDLPDDYSSGKGVVYFLHTIGSHPDFCSRIKGTKYRLEDGTSLEKDVNCYDNSVLNTSMLISDIIKYLKPFDKDYELIYFSDHGLVDINERPFKVHGAGNKFERKAVEVPFFFISSSQKENEILNRTYFLRDFPHTFADWIGVKADEAVPSKSIFNLELQQESFIISDDNEKVNIGNVGL
jgi:glucan phosphoethanolaminetransferase (alkaline phosphatase superfamily)